MVLKVLTLAGGLAGAAITSQFPEFSQQYVQRLGGAVDALAEVVADFDASAASEGFSRDAALTQMDGTEFVVRRRGDMERMFQRFHLLRADLTALETEGPFMRAYHLPRFSDRQVARAAWAAYQPAVPLNFAGLVFGGLGFLLGLAVFGMIRQLLIWPFRRKRAQA